jgi:hypothetical protein
MSVQIVLNENSALLRGYITWSGILLIKMLLMALLTGIQRTTTGVNL